MSAGLSDRPDMGPARGASAPAVAVRSVLWLALGTWVGAWLAFALVFAPLAFRVLPSSELAGQLVAPVISVLHYGGATAALLVAGSGALLGRGRVLVGLPCLLAVACLLSEWVVSPQIAALRPLLSGPEAIPAVVARFERLHQASTVVFGGVLLAAIALVVLHARRDASGEGMST